MKTKNALIVSGGSVLVSAADERGFVPADVLVRDGVVTAVGTGLDADGADVVDATGKLVHPGFVDAHIHLWQTPLRGLATECFAEEYFPTVHPRSQHYRASDLHAATLGGALELLAHGVTTVVDFCHTIHTPEHADAAVDALEASGIRALFAYSVRDRPELDSRTLRSSAERLRDAARIAARLGTGGRVGLALALNNVEHVSAEENAAEVARARELGVLGTLHSIRAGQIGALSSRGLLGPDLQIVHATACSDEELDLVAEHGGSIAVTPESEAAMMSVWPVTGRAVRRGIPVGLGVDVVSLAAGDVAAQARSALTLDRLADAVTHRLQGREPVRTATSPTLNARRALALATDEGARSVGLRDVGTLAPGQAADLVIRSVPAWGGPASDAAAHLLLHSSRADIDTVIVAGEVRIRGGEPVGVDTGQVLSALREAHAHVAG